jgi:hypothetical protein
MKTKKNTIKTTHILGFHENIIRFIFSFPFHRPVRRLKTTVNNEKTKQNNLLTVKDRVKYNSKFESRENMKNISNQGKRL